jgi:hypothetical protein
LGSSIPAAEFAMPDKITITLEVMNEVQGRPNE